MDDPFSMKVEGAGAQAPADDSFSDKAWREIDLLGEGLSGFTTAAVESFRDRPLETAGKLAVSVGLGIGMGYLTRGRGLAPMLAGGIGAGATLSFISDVDNNIGVVGRAFADNWRSADNYSANSLAVRQSMGQFLFDTTLMTAGGLGGAFVGNRFIPRALRLESAQLAPGTYTHLLAEMKAAGLSESKLVSGISKENLLGTGGNATVYQVPGLQSYVVRVPNSFHGGLPGAKLEAIPDILPGANIGQPIARLGDWKVLRKQDGIPAGGPLYRARKQMGDEAADRIYTASLRKAAEMPQSAYDDFARTLMLLEKNGLQFDPSKAGNVLVDASARRFNVVDVSPTNAQSPHLHSTSDMVVTLMDNGSAWKVKGPDLTAHYRAIFTKSMKAAENTGLRQSSSKDSSFDYSMQLAGLKKD